MALTEEQRKYYREYYHRHGHKIRQRERRAVLTEEQKEQRRERERQHRLKHIERERARSRDLYYKALDNNPELRREMSEKAVEWRKNNPFRAMLNAARARAKKNGFPFNLTEEHVKDIWTGVCPVFNTTIEIGQGTKKKRMLDKHTASLDKIVPEKGYVIGNVRWISLLANTMKNSANQTDLQTFAKWVLMQE
jgi:hypothetical protein